jgi:hypothetical protein
VDDAEYRRSWIGLLTAAAAAFGDDEGDGPPEPADQFAGDLAALLPPGAVDVNQLMAGVLVLNVRMLEMLVDATGRSGTDLLHELALYFEDYDNGS